MPSPGNTSSTPMNEPGSDRVAGCRILCRSAILQMHPPEGAFAVSFFHQVYRMGVALTNATERPGMNTMSQVPVLPQGERRVGHPPYLHQRRCRQDYRHSESWQSARRCWKSKPNRSGHSRSAN
jgi:hypothetical protein